MEKWWGPLPLHPKGDISKGDINLCHSPQDVIMLLINSLVGEEAGSEASTWPFQLWYILFHRRMNQKEGSSNSQRCSLQINIQWLAKWPLVRSQFLLRTPFFLWFFTHSPPIRGLFKHFRSPGISINWNLVSNCHQNVWVFCIIHTTFTFVNGHRSHWGRPRRIITLYTSHDDTGSSPRIQWMDSGSENRLRSRK